MNYQNFDDIPNFLKKRILKLEQPDVQLWVQSKIPALGNMSVIETLNTQDGEKKVAQMLDRMSEFID